MIEFCVDKYNILVAVVDDLRNCIEVSHLERSFIIDYLRDFLDEFAAFYFCSKVNEKGL